MMLTNRSSHRKCSVRKDVLRNFAKLAGKHLCRSLFFNKVADLQAYSFIKKRLQHRRFPAKSMKVFKNTYFEEHLRTTASVDYLT